MFIEEEATGSILKITTAKVNFKLDRKENVRMKSTTWGGSVETP